MSTFLPNAIGFGVAGDSLAAIPPLLVSGNVWYVDVNKGQDGPPPAGLNPPRPLATLLQAVTNAADHDIIAIAGGHEEFVPAPIAIGKSLTLIGCGSSGGEPSAVFFRNDGNVSLLTITAPGVQLRGLKFAGLSSGTSPGPAPRITVAGARFRMIGCVTEMSQADKGPAVQLLAGADSAQFRNCVFASVFDPEISDATLVAPDAAIRSAAALLDVRMLSCTFDAGERGFTGFYAVDLSAGAVTRFEGERLSLLRGADVKLHPSTTGWINVELATEGSRVDW